MHCRHVLLIVVFAASGCAQTAVVQTWQPAQCDVTGIERIAVIDFAGPEGPAVAAAITSRLWENEFYSLVDHTEFQPVLQTGFSGHPAPGLNDLLTAAARANVDALLMGEVVAYDCQDRSSSSTEFYLGQDSLQSQSGDGMTTRSGTEFGLSSNHLLNREGTVSLTIRLVDVKTGEVRASRKVARHFDAQQLNGQGELPTRGQILDSLLDECLDESVALLAPHRVECSMPLARGNLFCRQRGTLNAGNSLARRGEWQQAAEQWERVLKEQPENDAALFNLALAAAHRHDYAAAESLAMQAIRVRHTCDYARGLEQIRAQRSSFQEAVEQRDARTCPQMTTAAY